MTDTFLRRGAAYIRVSTDKQEELSPDAQKRLILDYADKNQITVSPVDIYVERGISGRSAKHRPAFQNMIAKAKSKEHPFDVILVWKFSRFARNQEESIVYKSMLQKDRVEVISISEPVIDGPFGSLIERIIEWMDEYYSIRLSGEVLRGMTEKALRGGYQSIPPYGYAFTGSFPPEVNLSQAVVVQSIYADFLSGKTCLEIARSLNSLGICTAKGNPFESRTIKYILKNPFYCGKIRWNYTRHGGEIKNPKDWIVTEGRHEPLIPESEWLAVQKIMKRQDSPCKPRDISSCRHWLSGVLKCSACGASLGYNSGGGYFQCWKYTKGMCNFSHSISEKKAEAHVIAGLKASVLSCHLQYSLPASPPRNISELAVLEGQYKKLSLKRQRASQAYENGIDTLEEYRATKARLSEEENLLKEKIRSLTACDGAEDFDLEKEGIYDLTSAVNLLSDPAIDYGKKGAALRSVVEKIVYDKKKEHFSFFFYLK